MIYLCHADGKLPNLALMRLQSFLRSRGETTRLLRKPQEYVRGRDPAPTAVYGSSIFAFSEPVRAAFDAALDVPIHWGGTGVRVASSLTEIDAALTDDVLPDYDGYPGFSASIGFLTRGCRLNCAFCVVPRKEGKPNVVSSVGRVWRGDPYPRHLEVLDNDAFAQPLRPFWREAVAELRAGGYRVCFSQGLNLRLIDEEAAHLLSQVTYTDHSFSLKSRVLYTAWDNLGDEDVFRRGVATLQKAGIPTSRLTVYMLIGYRPRETWDEIMYRYLALRGLGVRQAYPMVYDKRARPDLAAFARWALGRTRGKVPWPEYAPGGARERRLTPQAIEESDAAWRRVAAGWKPPRKLPRAE